MVRGEEGHAVWRIQGQHTNHRAETDSTVHIHTGSWARRCLLIVNELH